MMDTDRPLVVFADGEGVKDYDLQSRSPEQLEEEIADLCTHIDAATYRSVPYASRSVEPPGKR